MASVQFTRKQKKTYTVYLLKREDRQCVYIQDDIKAGNTILLGKIQSTGLAHEFALLCANKYGDDDYIIVV